MLASIQTKRPHYAPLTAAQEPATVASVSMADGSVPSSPSGMAVEVNETVQARLFKNAGAYSRAAPDDDVFYETPGRTEPMIAPASKGSRVRHTTTEHKSSPSLHYTMQQSSEGNQGEFGSAVSPATASHRGQTFLKRFFGFRGGGGGEDINSDRIGPISNPFPVVSPLVQLAAVASISAMLMGYNLSVLNTSLPTIVADLRWCPEVSQNGGLMVVPETGSGGDLKKGTRYYFGANTRQCPEAKPKQSLVQGGLIVGAEKDSYKNTELMADSLRQRKGHGVMRLLVFVDVLPALVLGSLFSGALSSMMGRRITLLLINMGLVVGGTTASLSWTFHNLFFSRVFTGVFSGLATIVPGVYMSEMAPPEMRAFYSLLSPLAINLGVFLGIAVGFPFVLPSPEDFTLTEEDWAFNRWWWRAMLFLPAPFAVIASYCLLRYYTYDTPLFLRLSGRSRSAAAVEVFLYVPNERAQNLNENVLRQASMTDRGLVVPITVTSEGGVLGADVRSAFPEGGPQIELETFTPSVTGDSDEGRAVSSSVASPPVSLKRASMLPQQQRERGGSSPGPNTGEVGDTFGAKLPSHRIAVHQTDTEDEEGPQSTIKLTQALIYIPVLARKIWVGWAFAILQQLTGINVFVAASNKLFIEAGLAEEYATLASGAMAFLALVCSAIAAFNINRVSRRFLLIGGALGMSAALGITPVSNAFIKDGPTPLSQLLSVVSTLLFVCVYSFSYGPGLFVYLNELLPPQVKDTALAVAFGLNWTFCFIVIFSATLLTQLQAVTLFSIICFLTALFALICASETRTIPALAAGRGATTLSSSSTSPNKQDWGVGPKDIEFGIREG